MPAAHGDQIGAGRLRLCLRLRDDAGGRREHAPRQAAGN